jgi:hypothetical protein
MEKGIKIVPGKPLGRENKKRSNWAEGYIVHTYIHGNGDIYID